MKYTIPTNKLRDLIAVLQLLDPDIETTITEVDVLVDGRRVLSTGQLTEKEFVEEVLDCCDIKCEPDINSLVISIEELLNDRGTLMEQRNELQSQIDRIKRVLEVD